MRLLIATGLYPPEIGGPATYSKLLYDELPPFDVEVQVASFGAVRHLPFGIRHIVYLFKLIGRGRHADLIYAQDAASVGVPSALAALVLGKPLWVRVPGDYAWEQGVQRFGIMDTLDVFVTKTSYARPVRLLRAIQKWVAHRAEHVIVPSHYMVGIVVAGGVSKDKVSVIYSSVKPLEVEETKEALRERLELSGQVIVSAGRLVPWKGFAGLISAFAILKPEFPDAVLVIAGEGSLLSELTIHAEKLGVADAIRFVGRLAQMELCSYIKAADVFVLNTAYEGLSHQLIEVMLLGTPIVTTSVGGNPELIRDGEDGLLVPYNNVEVLVLAIKRLLLNPAEGTKFAELAKKHGSKFVSKNSISRLLEELKKRNYIP